VAVKELDKRVDKVLAKRRWMHEQHRRDASGVSDKQHSSAVATEAAP